MKRITVIILILVLATLNSMPVFAISNPVFLVQINGTLDSEITFNGEGTLIIDWQIKANRDDLTLRYAQGFRLAYDNTVLQLMSWDGSEIIDDSRLGESFSMVPKTGCVGEFNTDLIIFAAQSKSDGVGYLNYLLGSPFDAYDCLTGTYMSLAKVRFAFRIGKTTDNLTSNSIRCMTIKELDATAQATAILINTDENELTSYEYCKQIDGAAIGNDTLNIPTITYPHSIASNEDKETIDQPNKTDLDTNSSAHVTDGENKQANETLASGDVSEPSDLADASDAQTNTNMLALNKENTETRDANILLMIIAIAGGAVLIAVIMILFQKSRKSAKETEKNDVADSRK